MRPGEPAWLALLLTTATAVDAGVDGCVDLPWVGRYGMYSCNP